MRRKFGTICRYAVAGFALAITVVTFEASPAMAAEAYLCDAGRVVYVELADLERMKRTDACIASYYGLTVATQAASQPETAAPATGAGTMPEATLAKAATERSTDAAPASSAIAPGQFALRRAVPGRGVHGTSAALPVRTMAMKRSGAGVVAVSEPVASPAAAPSTDYRNVRVINASATAEQWFHHDF